MLRTDWFQKRIRAKFHDRTKWIVGFMKDWLKCQIINPLVKWRHHNYQPRITRTNIKTKPCHVKLRRLQYTACIMFTRILKRSGDCLLYTTKETYVPELVPIFYYRNKTRVHMFYFLSIQRCTAGSILPLLTCTT